MGKFLRVLGIIFMTLTAVFTLMSGIGTICVSVAAEKYASMAGIAGYKWLYGIFAFASTAIGVLGIRAMVLLARRKASGYSSTIFVLASGIAVGIVRIIVSRSLRGKSMPVDYVVYITVLTLIIFMIFKIPSVWKKVDYGNSHQESSSTAEGISAMIMGIICLSIDILVGSTHTWGGINHGDAFRLPMEAAGIMLTVTGCILVFKKGISAFLYNLKKKPGDMTV